MQEPGTTTERTAGPSERVVETAVAGALPGIMSAFAAARERDAAAEVTLESWYFCGDGSVMRPD